MKIIKIFNNVLNLIILILSVIIPFALFVIVEFSIDKTFRKNCEAQNGTYIQENMGFGKGHCILKGDSNE